MANVPDEVTQWCRRFAEAVGVDAPTEAEIDGVLTLAGVAAHASARQAAPVTCWLAAKAGITLDDALSSAQALERQQ
jgi:hypothetical protein